MLELVPLREPECRRFAEVYWAERINRDRGLLAIGGDLPILAWSGRSLVEGRRLHRRIALYREELLVATFDDAPFPVRDLAVHPIDPVLAIATGAYDGDLYQGALLLWNWETGAVRSVFDESREIDRVRWEPDGRLAIAATSANDLEDREDTGAVLDVRGTCSVQALEPYAETPFGFGDYDAFLDTMTRARDELGLSPRGMIWDLAWTMEGWLAAARSDGCIELWSAAGERKHVVRTDGNVVQLLPQLDRLLVHRIGVRNSELYELRGHELEHWMDLPGLHTCSIDAAGRILARATSSRPGRRDLLIGPNKRVVLEDVLGDYDASSNFLRIDGAPAHYLLRGGSSSKELAMIEEGELVARALFAWDSDGERRTTNSATLLDDDVVCSYGVHPPDSRGAIWIERRARRGARIWRHEVPAAATALVTWPAAHAVVAALIDGSLCILDFDGDVLLEEPFLLDGVISIPTALAVHGETLAIGTIDGRIAMRSLR